MSVPPDPGDVRYNDLEAGSERRRRRNKLQSVFAAQMDPRKVAATQMVGYGPWLQMGELFGGRDAGSGGLCGKV